MFRSDSKRVTFTRQELFTQVWTTPMSTLCKTYGLSDVGLRKVCQRHNIPTPPLGYWAKKQFGKTVTQPSLPKQDDSSADRIEFLLPNESSEDLQRSLEIQAMIDSEKHNENRIRVEDNIVNVHPLVERTERSLRAAKPEEDGLVYSRAKRCLSVAVSPDNISRAMRLMDALVKALETRGYTLTTSKESDHLCVTLLGEKLAIHLSESLARREKTLTREEKKQRQEQAWWQSNIVEYVYFPTGQLTLSIDGEQRYGYQKNWSDGSKRRLEECLNSFIAGLLRAADVTKTKRSARERWDKEWAETQRQRQVESERIQKLESMLIAWRKCRDIRELVAAFERALGEQGRVLQQGSELDMWLCWARKRADTFDPVIIE